MTGRSGTRSSARCPRTPHKAVRPRRTPASGSGRENFSLHERRPVPTTDEAVLDHIVCRELDDPPCSASAAGPCSHTRHRAADAFLLAAVDAGLLDPVTQRRVIEAQIPGRLGHRLPAGQHQLHGIPFELCRELPTGSSLPFGHADTLQSTRVSGPPGEAQTPAGPTLAAALRLYSSTVPSQPNPNGAEPSRHRSYTVRSTLPNPSSSCVRDWEGRGEEIQGRLVEVALKGCHVVSGFIGAGFCA